MEEKDEAIIKLQLLVESHTEKLKEHTNQISEINSNLNMNEKNQIRTEAKIDEIFKEMKNMSINFNNKMELVSTKIDAQSDRMSSLEKDKQEEMTKPKKKWDDIKWDIIKALSVGIIVAVVYYLLKVVPIA